MIKSFILVLCPILILVGNLSGQELHVFFDVQTKNLSYEKNDKSINSAKVKPGEQIVFHLQNFNSFLYTAKVESSADLVQVSTFHNTNSVDSGTTQNESPNGFMGLLSIGSSAGNGNDITKNISFGGFGYGADVESTNMLTQLKSEYDQTVLDMQKIEKQLKYINEDVDAYVETKIVNSIILEELEKLKTNPRLKPAQIKALSLEYLQKIFKSETTDEISLSSIIENADSKKVLKEIIHLHNEQSEKYISSKANLKELSSRLNLVTLVDDDVKNWKYSANVLNTDTDKTVLKIEENKSRLQNLYEDAQQSDLQILVGLRYEYEAIANNDFSETFRFEAEGDQTNITVKLIKKESSTNLVDNTVIEFPSINIPVTGGMKVNTSMGLSFGKFSSENQQYFIKDSVIAGQATDKFSPLITSFFHFYPQHRGQLTIGGSFGVGIPINGENGFQSISFLLGPSIIIGKGEHLVISGGIMGGKTQKLSNGLSVGDTFISSVDNIPTYSSYEIGYYLGLSFNLLSN